MPSSFYLHVNIQFKIYIRKEAAILIFNIILKKLNKSMFMRVK